jgi:hypothetical protein
MRPSNWLLHSVITALVMVVILLPVERVRAQEESSAPPATVASTPRIGQLYFSVDPDPARRAETDQTTFKSGGYRVYGFIDYFDVSAPNTLTYYWLRNDSSDNTFPSQPEEGKPFVPPTPTGVWTAGFTLGSSSTGKLTLVVQLNGQEVARRDCYNE